MEDPGLFYSTDNRRADPHLQNWSVLVRVARTPRVHILTDKASK